MINFKPIQTPSLLIVKKGYAFCESSSGYILLMGSLKKDNKTLLLLSLIKDKSNATKCEYMCFFNGKIMKFSIYPSEEDIFSLVG